MKRLSVWINGAYNASLEVTIEQNVCDNEECRKRGPCLVMNSSTDEYGPHVICLKCLEKLGLTYNEPSTSSRKESDNAVKD